MQRNLRPYGDVSRDRRQGDCGLAFDEIKALMFGRPIPTAEVSRSRAYGEPLTRGS